MTVFHPLRTGRFRPIADIVIHDQGAGMAGLRSDIPFHLLEGGEIWTITVGAASVSLELIDGNRIMLQPYGMTEQKGDWLYNLKLSGDDSLQTLVGQTIERIEILSEGHARIQFSGGKAHDLVPDDPEFEIASFRIGNAEYFA